jgi:protein-tyrosine-phosphatase
MHQTASRQRGAGFARPGITLPRRRSTHLDEVRALRFDYLITLCDRVREVCPEFPEHPAVIHWSVRDPARTATSDEGTYPAFVDTLRGLGDRIGFPLARIAAAHRVAA